MSPILLIGGMVVALLAALVLVFFVIAPPAPRIAAERRIAPGVERASLLRRASSKATGAVDDAFSQGKVRLYGDVELDLAGVKATRSQFIIYVASASSVLAVFGAVLGLLNGTSFLLALLFAVIGPIAAKLVLIVRTSSRRAKFADQIDDTVQLLAGGLRAGHGLSRTVSAVATEADAPMGEELARVVNETRLGRSLPHALTTAAQRMKSDDFEWVSEAVAINAETGGNLADVLDQVGRTIRERNQIRRQVRTLSAEGRLSGIILIALPFFVFFALMFLQPGYVSVFFTSILGLIALVVAAVLLIIGMVWIAAVVKVRF